MKFDIDGHAILWFSDDVVAKMEAYRQQSSEDREACGVLLGRLFEENEDIAIDDVTIPQKEDVRRRTTVFRSSKHSELAIGRWKTSGRTESFLGLWHTHPEDYPSPSSVDVADWERVIRKGIYPGRQLIFVIVGIVELAVWLGEASTRGWNLKRKVNIRKLERT